MTPLIKMLKLTAVIISSVVIIYVIMCFMVPYEGVLLYSRDNLRVILIPSSPDDLIGVSKGLRGTHYRYAIVDLFYFDAGK